MVRPEKVRAFLDPLPVRKIHGVGPATERALNDMKVQTVADLRGVAVEDLVQRFGKHGRILHEFSQGIDERPVETHRERKSVGSENTYAEVLSDLAFMEAEVDRRSEEVAAALARSGFAGCTVTLKVRYDDFTTVTRSRTYAVPVHDRSTIAGCARDLLRRPEAVHRPVRLIGGDRLEPGAGAGGAAGAVRDLLGAVSKNAGVIHSRREWLSFMSLSG